ncbi:MAG TPA: hypothetical protein VH852_04680 [Hyphomicrobium sp.]
MRSFVRRSIAWTALAAALLTAAAGLSQAQPAATETPAADLKARIAEYKVKLAEYKKAREAYEKEAAPYWKSVSAKRAQRRKKRTRTLDDYVLEQPPLYAGPPEPVDPEAEGKPRVVPVVADFLANAKEQFGFVPQTPASEMDFKRAYAKVAAAAGLSKETCVRVYGFEATGNGRHDVQAGLEYGKPGERAISTALGYNQLLTTNTVGLMAESGDRFVAALRKKADGADGARKAELEATIAVLGKMIRFARSVPNDWSEHGKLAKTPKGIGLHALNLDIDVGPLLQTQKLMDSVEFAKRKGYDKPLSAAELEMMNLTGDGNGFDMVTLPAEMREKVPTSNFFQQGGYERNPVAIRNNTVAKLIAETDATMEEQMKLPGALELAAAFDQLAHAGD